MTDLLFHNGTILTMNEAAPTAEALAVRGRHILAVGGEAEVRAAVGSAEVIDLQGRCLLPGFHDSHVHLTQHGLELTQLNLQRAKTLEEGLELVKEYIETLPEGEWVLGAGFLMSRWNVSELHRQDLDKYRPGPSGAAALAGPSQRLGEFKGARAVRRPPPRPRTLRTVKFLRTSRASRRGCCWKKPCTLYGTSCPHLLCRGYARRCSRRVTTSPRWASPPCITWRTSPLAIGASLPYQPQTQTFRCASGRVSTRRTSSTPPRLGWRPGRGASFFRWAARSFLLTGHWVV